MNDRIARGVVRVAGWLVPSRFRGEWRAEWNGEITSSGTGHTLGRSLGAVYHALWLRREDWRMDDMGQDLRYALRGVVRRPLFSLVVVATIGLGIGVTTAMFSVVNGVLLQPLSHPNPEQLVMVWEHHLPRARTTNVVAPATYLAWKERADVFTAIGAVAPTSATLVVDAAPERIGVVMTTASFWRAMEVTPQLGRVFTEDEDRPGRGERYGVLTHGFWQRRFGGAADVVGKTLDVNGQPVRVVGVLPEDFRFRAPYDFNSTGAMDLYVSQQFSEDMRTWFGRWLQVVGRLRPDATIEQAQVQMATLMDQLRTEHDEALAGWTANVVPMHTQVVGGVQRALWIIFAAVVAVLLIACANVAHLLLARSIDREPEIATRVIMGATRTRIVRQLLTENMMLAMVGGGLGLGLAIAALNATRALGAASVPRVQDVTLDFPVLMFALVLTVATGLVFGALPAIRLMRADLSASLQEGGQRSGGSKSRARVRDGLIVAEMAMTAVLLAGTGLLVRSFLHLLDTGVGMQSEQLVYADVELPAQRYQSLAQRSAFFERLVEAVSSTSGVEGAAAITWAPLTGPGSATGFWVNDRPIPEADNLPVADIRWVHRDYHRVFGIPLSAGRPFDERDVEGGPTVAIVNEVLAARYWPGENPVGKHLSMEWGDTLVAEVIGVVGDVRHGGPATETREMIYWHHRQFQPFRMMTLGIRTAEGTEVVANLIRRVVGDLDPRLPVYNIRVAEDLLEESIAEQRFALVMLAAFASTAFLLAVVGIYGVTAYTVGQRTRELGIRIALGATGDRIVSDVVVAGAVRILAGLAIAALVVVTGNSVMASMVFGVPSLDLASMAAAFGVLAASGILAAYLPARRAGMVDPMHALRE